MLLNKRNRAIGIAFALPAFIIFTVFFFYPIIQALINSFYDWNGVDEKLFNGLANYEYIFRQSGFVKSIQNTLIVMLVAVLIQLPLSLLLAVMLNTEFKGFRFFRTVYFVPSIISTVVIGIMWSLIFHPYIGALNEFLRFLHLDMLIQNWLGDPQVALSSVNVVNLWHWVGYLVVIILAGLKSIPNEIIEASMIDGVNSFQKLVHITIPSIKWTLQVCVLLAITGSLKIFDLIYIMTSGGPGDATEVMATYMWRISFVSTKFGAGNAVAVLILGISLILTLISYKITAKE